MTSSKISGLYVVTDTTVQSKYSHTELAEMALKGGAKVIQVRDKQLDATELMQTGNKIREMCDDFDATFIINDRIDIAFATNSHGVHLGQKDLPISVGRSILGENKIIGGTASEVSDAIAVEKNDADYVGFGHIYPTKTKSKKYEPRGLSTLKQVKDSISIPVVAIGGINRDNAHEVVEAGADSIAVSSAVCAADEPVKASEFLAGLF